jgi:hypothetical protein
MELDGFFDLTQSTVNNTKVTIRSALTGSITSFFGTPKFDNPPLTILLVSIQRCRRFLRCSTINHTSTTNTTIP